MPRIHLRVARVPVRGSAAHEWAWQVRDHFNDKCCGTVRAGFAPDWQTALRQGIAELKRYLKVHCRYCGGIKSANARHCIKCQVVAVEQYAARGASRT